MINYEGISYNLETIIEFRSLKLLLEALAKRQIEHNVLFYGQNININKINNTDNLNQENNKDKTEIDNNENTNENNLEKIWMEKINNSGLIKLFIASQKKLEEQNNLINELKNKIDSLEKSRTLLKEKKETKKIINQEKEKEKDINEEKKETETEKEKEQNNKEDKEKTEIVNKPENKDIKKDKDVSIQNENIIINEEINRPPIKEEIILNEPTNTESKTINIYNTKNETKIRDTYDHEKLERKISALEEQISSIKEKLEEIEDNTENNTSGINTNKNDISRLKEKLKSLEKKINVKTQAPNPVPATDEKIPQEEKKVEEPNDNDERISNLENDLKDLEDKLISMMDEKFNEIKRRKSENNNNIMKEINLQKDKLRDVTDKINLELKTLKNKDEELENKIQSNISSSEIKKINEKIALLEQELEESATKEEMKHILGEVDKYEKELIKYKSFVVNQKEMNNKARDDMNQLKEDFEELKQNFSSLNDLLEKNSLNKLIENINNITDKFVEKNIYENDIKSINKKISELQMDINEHNRNFNEIIPKLQNIIQIHEFNKLKLIVEELKTKGVGEGGIKSLDTEEIIKNIKSMEAQVKIFMKKLETENEKEKERIQNDNCILASRPVGGFKCASCETYIGDIKDNNIYLPWNKYHGQDRPYRLGSSFSRILQGLNIEQNYNPFLHKKNYLKSENDKRYQIQTEALSVKKIRKIPPLNQLTISEANVSKKYNGSKSNNKTIDEHSKMNEYNGSGFMTNNKYKKKLNINLWGIKSLKNMGNDKNMMTLNILGKINKKNNISNNSYEKDNNNSRNIIQDKVVKITKKAKGNKINKSEDNENNLVIPNI